MMNNRLFLGLGLAIVLSGCSSTKNLHSVAVPEGSAVAVTIPAKKGAMSDDEIKAWPHADLMTDSIPGMSLDKAYEFLSDKKGTTVILGVIDSGIDKDHEDLKDNIWTNTDEIAGNGKDDDNNGYIDDIHGWNFLGGKGEATPEQLEVTRIYKMLGAKYEGKTRNDMNASEMDGFNYYQKVKKDYEKRIKEANENHDRYKQMKVYLNDADKATIAKLGKETYTIADLNSLDEAERDPFLMRVLGNGSTVEEANEQLDGGIEYYGAQVNTMYNPDFDGRTATGDDPYDIKDVPYGNAFTVGSLDDEMHGTHVTGIAMATRNNGVGMNGVAKNVKLLSVRGVPDGDEYDKDVALAIRYAVDNGAKVINMSFGKSYSPNAEWVYDAIKYSESKEIGRAHV